MFGDPGREFLQSSLVEVKTGLTHPGKGVGGVINEDISFIDNFPPLEAETRQIVVFLLKCFYCDMFFSHEKTVTKTFATLPTLGNDTEPRWKSVRGADFSMGPEHGSHSFAVAESSQLHLWVTCPLSFTCE